MNKNKTKLMLLAISGVLLLSILLVVSMNSNAETETWKQTSWADFSGGEMEDLEVIEEDEDTFLQLKTSENWGEFVRIDDGPVGGLLGIMGAWDSKRNQVVLFGGHDFTYQKDDTWIYDPSVDIFTKSKSINKPPARTNHIMIYDSNNDKVMLFGGMGFSSLYAKQDTWIYDPQTDSWNEVYPLNHPSPRYDHSMVYDSQNGVGVLYGGRANILTNFYTDTWTYDIKNNIWVEKSPVNNPLASYNHAMAFDSSKNVVVLYGGASLFEYNETWIYDTSSDTWIKKSPTLNPLKRSNHNMVYDSKNKKIVLFGGKRDGFHKDDTWIYNIENNTWIQKKQIVTPTNRSLYSMVYDNSRGKVLISGGTTTNNDKYAYFKLDKVDKTSADIGEWSDITIDHEGQPHISYFDDINDNLMYTEWNGIGWSKRKIDGNVLNGPTAIILDLQDFPHILYRSSSGDLYHSYEGSSGWNKEIVDTNHDDTTGLGLDLDIDKYGKLHAVYCYNINAGNSHLYYTQKTSSWSTPKALDMSGKTGIFPAIDVDRNGNPHISYQTITVQGSLLLYITSKDGSTSWESIESVDTSVPDKYCYSSIAVDPAGTPYISYTDSDYVLGFAYKYGSTWGTETLSTKNYGFHSSLSLDRNGRPHITSYYQDDGDLMYTWLDRGGEWRTGISNNNIENSSTSCAFDSVGRLHISYYGNSTQNYLGYAKLMLPTWEYDLSENEWTAKGKTRDGPSNRSGHTMIYDKEAKKMVLFGGYDNDITLDGTKYNNETWSYDPDTRIWQRQFPILKPSARFSHTMIYDTTHEVSILFGGTDNNRHYNDTWTYDLGCNLWTNKTSSKRPPARINHAMVFHSEIGKVVLHGGNKPAGSYMDDTWTFDLANIVWSELSSLIKPSPRTKHEMAFDSEKNMIVLACGSTYSGDYTWTYDNKWTDKSTSRPQLENLTDFEMIFDSEKNLFFLFGGDQQPSSPPYPYSDTTWIYSITGNKWTEISPQNKPCKRAKFGMAYSTNQEITVLFGGSIENLYECKMELDTYHYKSDNYETIGIYTSQPYAVHPDRGVKWGTIHWNAEVPIGADVEFQVAVSNDDSVWNFVGPDGTSNTFYNDATGGDLSSLSYGKWIRYKAFLRSAQAGDTPELHDVTITWREIEDSTVFLYSPNGGEDLLKEKYHTITWNATGDLLENPINLYFSTSGGKTWILIASDLENNGTYNWTVPNIETETGLVKVTCEDIYGNNISDVSDMTFAIDPPKESIQNIEDFQEESPKIEPINKENENNEIPEDDSVQKENVGSISSVSVFSAITGCLVIILGIIMNINRKIRKKGEKK